MGTIPRGETYIYIFINSIPELRSYHDRCGHPHIQRFQRPWPEKKCDEQITNPKIGENPSPNSAQGPPAELSPLSNGDVHLVLRPPRSPATTSFWLSKVGSGSFGSIWKLDSLDLEKNQRGVLSTEAMGALFRCRTIDYHLPAFASKKRF